jgi:hypothetical protein
MKISQFSSYMLFLEQNILLRMLWLNFIRCSKLKKPQASDYILLHCSTCFFISGTCFLSYCHSFLQNHPITLEFKTRSRNIKFTSIQRALGIGWRFKSLFFLSSIIILSSSKKIQNRMFYFNLQYISLQRTCRNWNVFVTSKFVSTHEIGIRREIGCQFLIFKYSIPLASW